MASRGEEMASREASQEETVGRIVRRINELWLNKQYEQIGELVDEGIVFAAPGFEHRVRGREAYVASYREYDTNATTREFRPGEPEVDVNGDVAVAVYPFRIVYDLQGKTYREKGHDILVLSRASGDWRVVWRTMQTQSTEDVD